jgi:hypothetical protein
LREREREREHIKKENKRTQREISNKQTLVKQEFMGNKREFKKIKGKQEKNRE